jgi:pyrimidine-nucleoside phosphorylase
MLATEIIAKKRDGLELSDEELQEFIGGYTRGHIPDYQAAAWLMAVYLRSMTLREIVSLTSIMAQSGQILDLNDIAPFIVDKHSTGGVGDKTTLVVAPLVASTGLPIGKMSGRGLGFSGGTLDKLESIPGFRCNLTSEEFRDHLRRYGIVVAGQTEDLAPGDGKLYALRDVTATVPSIPLIASSIMSKKIASGANGIVLDVKLGRGAFMKTLEEAESLTRVMLGIGQGKGRKMAAVISNMDQPLGNAVGNSLEVIEAIETLQGEGPADFVEHCLVVSSQMLLIAGHAENLESAQEMLQDALNNGSALDMFSRWIESQGGDSRVLDDPHNVLPKAKSVHAVQSSGSGWISSLNALEIGLAALQLGAGRAVKGQPIDHAVGIVLHHKIGDKVDIGDSLCTIHSSYGLRSNRLREIEDKIESAYRFSDTFVPSPPLIIRIL